MLVVDGGLVLSSEWCALVVFLGSLRARTDPGGVCGGRGVNWLMTIGGRVELARELVSAGLELGLTGVWFLRPSLCPTIGGRTELSARLCVRFLLSPRPRNESLTGWKKYQKLYINS